jgi:transcriptional regulator with XRE-family HTH domain
MADMTYKETRQLSEEHRRALGSRMVQLRRARRWSQRELGRRTGIRYMRLSKLENGHATPTLAELVLIAEALDAGLDELARGVPPPAELAVQGCLAPLQELEAAEHAVLGKLLRVLVAGFKATRPA